MRLRWFGLLVAAPSLALLPSSSRADPLWGGADITASAFQWRPEGDRRRDWQQGLGLAWGPTLADDEGPWRFTGLTQFEVSMLDSRSWAVGITATAFEAAARFGFLEPQARVGFQVATVDVLDGQWSAELFSPRAEAGLGVRFGRVRIAVGVESEYFWRWWGPSVLERGFVLDLRYEKPWHPPRPPQ